MAGGVEGAGVKEDGRRTYWRIGVKKCGEGGAYFVL